MEAGITSEDLDLNRTLNYIRSAERWVIGKLKAADLESVVEDIISGDPVPERLAVAATYKAVVLILGGIYGSGGSRSQTNFPESFVQVKAGQMEAQQPNWITRSRLYNQQAEEAIADYITSVTTDRLADTAFNNTTGSYGLAARANRDFDHHARSSFYGDSGYDWL